MFNRLKNFDWKRFLPLVYIDVMLPLIRVRSTVMYNAAACRITEYISIACSFWKWKFEFTLYERWKS